MVLENLGYGDPSDVSAATYSVISASNLWFFNTSRRGEVDVKRYWSGVYNSPAKSAWLHTGLNISTWEVHVDGSESLTYTKYFSPLMLAQNIVLTAQPVVFPKLPMPGWWAATSRAGGPHACTRAAVAAQPPAPQAGPRLPSSPPS
ncbi:hypothetical protein MNEG_12692 [Monoraphidium neglectum]|uniref:Uncharacterized protein n=1 Tax=Monoraphidium neglectum TaxID=145388 RepID=A0A0D2LUD2_9CHLO|nr:hypothetical protein MNEG_12692 [Monoraphidium neglectum]KIY95269.1 hypothetical protein MNEG_12692 [Monoraphidium neglectum]|eukprot:XP_013894289.1 hypothetical protein MNEG_12692 [Monoraphidium neglectum]